MLGELQQESFDKLSHAKSSRWADKELSGSHKPKDKDTIENPPTEERSLK